MSTLSEIKAYIASQPKAKHDDVETLHRLVLRVMPKGSKLWFLDGKDSKGKTVSNPQIGYGSQIMTYADGKTKEFFRVGISTNASGISVYIMGISDKAYLPKTYSKNIGKADVSGYCIKFKTLKDIDMSVLTAAIQDGVMA